MKEYIKEHLSSFFIITTLINIAMYILGIIFRPDQQFGYEAFIYPPLNAALCCIPGLIMYSKKELSIKQMLIRKILQLFMIILIMLILTMGADFEPGTAAGLTISVIVIFIAVHLIQWYLDIKTAARMTEALKAFQKNTDDTM